MGKFTDTRYKKTMDSLVESTQKVLNNPYYLFTEQTGTKVDYYRVNREKTTLDEDSRLHMSTVGDTSAFRYNLIKDMYIFGFEKVTLNIDIGDVGTEADPIEGEAIILPKTIIPMDGDCFVVTYLKEPLLFRVNAVNQDTLDNGSNVYKISYKLFGSDKCLLEDLKKQVVEEYEFSASNVGTDFTAVIKSSDYKLIESLEALLQEVSDYFKRMFFKDSLQTFVYSYDGKYFYDPYMIEFCIRNKIFSYGSEYSYITQQCYLPTTFALDYSKSIFYSIEQRDPKNMSKRIFSGMSKIDDIYSLFYYKGTEYYMVDYCQNNVMPTSRVQIFPSELLENIKNNTYFDLDTEEYMYNLLIAYMNEDTDYLKTKVLECIKTLNIQDNKNCFYGLVFSMYVIQKFIENMLR